MKDTNAMLKRERGTLTWLRGQAGALTSAPNGLYDSINNALLRMKDSVGMQVFLHWPVLHESRFELLSIYVGGIIEIANSAIQQLSYCLCIAEGTANGGVPRVLRKYHFDYANPDIKPRTPHPVFHLQYPGRLAPTMPHQLDDAHQDPDLDEPRIFYIPMSLAMVLHMAFREFPDPFSDHIRKDGSWISILRKDEDALLRPFFQTCNDHIKNRKVIMDAMYGD